MKFAAGTDAKGAADDTRPRAAKHRLPVPKKTAFATIPWLSGVNHEGILVPWGHLDFRAFGRPEVVFLPKLTSGGVGRRSGSSLGQTLLCLARTLPCEQCPSANANSPRGVIFAAGWRIRSSPQEGIQRELRPIQGHGQPSSAFRDPRKQHLAPFHGCSGSTMNVFWCPGVTWMFGVSVDRRWFLHLDFASTPPHSWGRGTPSSLSCSFSY